MLIFASTVTNNKYYCCVVHHSVIASPIPTEFKKLNLAVTRLIRLEFQLSHLYPEFPPVLIFQKFTHFLRRLAARKLHRTFDF